MKGNFNIFPPRLACAKEKKVIYLTRNRIFIRRLIIFNRKGKFT